MQISFPREQHFIFEDGVDFPAVADGRQVPCKISRAALDDHFNAETEGTLQAFLKHRSEIERHYRPV